MDVGVAVLVELLVRLLLVCGQRRGRAPVNHHRRLGPHVRHRLRVVLVLRIVLVDGVVVDALVGVVLVDRERPLLLLDVQVLAGGVRLADLLHHAGVVG